MLKKDLMENSTRFINWVLLPMRIPPDSLRFSLSEHGSKTSVACYRHGLGTLFLWPYTG